MDEKAYNRGLYFTPAMGSLCGERHRVERRLEKIIVDGTGEMRQLRNTVFLEGSLCGCACVAFGGCPRASSPIGGRFGFAGLRSLESGCEQPVASEEQPVVFLKLLNAIRNNQRVHSITIPLCRK